LFKFNQMPRKINKLSKTVRQYNEIDISGDCMKYWRAIRYWALDKYQITSPDLDMLFFLYSEGLFHKSKFHEFDTIFNWDRKRFKRLLEDGWIVKWRDSAPGQTALYTMSFKGKKAINTIYKVMNGEPMGEQTPMFRTKKTYSKGVYRNFIKKLNKEFRESKQRRGTESQ
jgi:hypothetical protein